MPEVMFVYWKHSIQGSVINMIIIIMKIDNYLLPTHYYKVQYTFELNIYKIWNKYKIYQLQRLFTCAATKGEFDICKKL